METKFAGARAFAQHLAADRAAREREWLELSRWLAPHRGVFQGEDCTRRETRRNPWGFTQAAAYALLRGASGITSGMTPRNISWFEPDFDSPELGEASGARAWLDEIDRRMKAVLAEGGFYQAIHAFNTDLLWAGCALLYAEAGQAALMRFECAQVGTYAVALDELGRLDAVARSMAWHPARIAKTFGRAAMSEGSRAMLDKNPYAPVRVWQLVRRRDWREPGRADSRNMPWESLFWEDGGEDFLHEGGYEEMPYFFTCWHEGATPYGTGPGDDALGDARQVDKMERDKLEGLGKLVRPPLQYDYTLKDVPDLSAGGLTPVREKTLIAPIMDLGPYAQSFRYLQDEIRNVSQRLEQELMASIFASMPLEQRPRDMSATEFLERKREALQQLGPVISAYEPNVLTPLLFRVLASIDRAGLAPPPPEALAGLPLFMKMEFVSPMSNALRQTGAETTRALLQDVAMLAQAAQSLEVLDKVDLDQVVDELATGLGVPGKVIRSDEDVARIRQERAEAQARQQEAVLEQAGAAQMMQNMQSAANTAKTLSEIETGGGNDQA